jgi:hypothetical protein
MEPPFAHRARTMVKSPIKQINDGHIPPITMRSFLGSPRLLNVQLTQVALFNQLSTEELWDSIMRQPPKPENTGMAC